MASQEQKQQLLKGQTPRRKNSLDRRADRRVSLAQRRESLSGVPVHPRYKGQARPLSSATYLSRSITENWSCATLLAHQ